MDFTRKDLTDAENFINMSRVQPYSINQFSFNMLNKQAVKDFKIQSASNKIMKITKSQYFHNKKLIKKLDLAKLE
jgi:hypothetical protein